MSKRKGKQGKGDSLWVWIAIGCFCTGALWWVGLILLILNSNGRLPPLSRRRRNEDEQRFEAAWGEPIRQPAAGAPVKKKRRGLAAAIAGAAIAGLGALRAGSVFWEIIQDILYGYWDASWIPYYLGEGAWGLLFLAVGAVVAGFGLSRMRKEKLYTRYRAMVGDRTAVSIHAMADALQISYEKACRQLQDMIDKGWFGDTAYLDLSKGRLMLDGSGLDYEEPPEPEKAPERAAEETISEEESILRKIRADNNLIDNAEISAKIDRIEELTRKIFSFIREKPEKAGELRSFLNYYLPQTLKILETYARLEAQNVEGENIRTAKQRIEGIMDTLVESYERQLDKLFEGDVLDITSDIDVMEAMLARDGLTEDDLLKKD